MTAAAVRRWCLAQAGSTEEFPFGERVSVFKVAGKMFALSMLAGRPLEVSVKCDPEIAASLRASYEAVRPGYHLNKRHWITITLDGSLGDRAVRELIQDSYDLVVSGLSRRRRAELSSLG